MEPSGNMILAATWRRIAASSSISSRVSDVIFESVPDFNIVMEHVLHHSYGIVRFFCGQLAFTDGPVADLEPAPDLTDQHLDLLLDRVAQWSGLIGSMGSTEASNSSSPVLPMALRELSVEANVVKKFWSSSPVLSG